VTNADDATRYTLDSITGFVAEGDLLLTAGIDFSAWITPKSTFDSQFEARLLCSISSVGAFNCFEQAAPQNNLFQFFDGAFFDDDYRSGMAITYGLGAGWTTDTFTALCTAETTTTTKESTTTAEEPTTTTTTDEPTTTTTDEPTTTMTDEPTTTTTEEPTTTMTDEPTTTTTEEPTTTTTTPPAPFCTGTFVLQSNSQAGRYLKNVADVGIGNTYVNRVSNIDDATRYTLDGTTIFADGTQFWVAGRDFSSYVIVAPTTFDELVPLICSISDAGALTCLQQAAPQNNNFQFETGGSGGVFDQGMAIGEGTFSGFTIDTFTAVCTVTSTTEQSTTTIEESTTTTEESPTTTEESTTTTEESTTTTTDEPTTTTTTEESTTTTTSAGP
jgi:hypothetical protein